MSVAPLYSRIQALDLIRGIAVLGILVVNIWAFALPFSAYANPLAYGDMTGINRWIWLLSYVLVQEKFITIFSILFGAGVALFVEHARAKQQPAAALHYRRIVVLLVIGLLHGYGFWSGDILTVYAVIALLLYAFVGCSQRVLLIWSLSLLVLSVLLIVALASLIGQSSAAELADMQASWQPTAAQLAQELADYRAGWWQQMNTRVPTTVELETMVLSFYSVRLLGQMVLGIWLYRSGFFTGTWSKTQYRVIAGLGLFIGLVMAYRGASGHLAANFSFEHAMGLGQLWNNVGSLLAAFGYMALFMLWSQSQWAIGLRSVLERAGRMGFSLYLGSSLICTTLFYGHGFGLFGYLDRAALFGVVLAVWLVLLWFANWWLAGHQQGPMEQFWRFCTYGRQHRTALQASETSS